MLTIAGMIWISSVFLQGDKTSEEFLLESLNSHIIKFNFIGNDIGYYRIFMPEFFGEEIFVQILDTKNNVIAEQGIHTKMSVGYFDYTKGGEYSLKITNISEKAINLKVELGDTNSQNMIPSGVIVLVGSLIIIITSYIKLKNYKIAHPDENIS